MIYTHFNTIQTITIKVKNNKRLFLKNYKNLSNKKKACVKNAKRNILRKKYNSIFIKILDQ